MEALLFIITIAVVIYAGVTQAKLEGLKEDIRNLNAEAEAYRNEVLELEERNRKLYIANLRKDKAMDCLTALKADEFERDKVQFGNWLLNNKNLESINGKSVTDADLQNYYYQQNK